MYARTRVRELHKLAIKTIRKMTKKQILAVLLLMVAGLQTAWGQGFRVYQSDGTQLQFSLSTDSIVFDNGLSGDEVFGPFTPVNQCIAKTWYMSKTESFTFNADGTTDYMEGATYKFFPYQGNLVFYSASGVPMNILRVYEVTAERMIVTTLNGSSIMIWSTTVPPQYVTSIVLSETSLTLDVDAMKTLTATVLPDDADNKAVTWESSNVAVAEVNQNGRVITNAEGTCTITCRAMDGSGVYAECLVTVGGTDDEQTFVVNGVSFTMIPVEGGTFQMGSNDSDAYGDEQPVHQVTLSSFSIGETEVTQELWQAVMGSNPSYLKGSKLPVEQVSWNDCQTFIGKLNELTGKTFRLPTEAEWEYAARGGSKSQGYIFSGSNTIGDVAWYTSNSGSTTHEVATKAANELGIYDMSGNVWEWCQDWYGDYSGGSQTNPTGPTSGSDRVVRGGSWYGIARSCRVSYRDGSTPTYSDYDLGFRLAQ